LAAHIKKRDRRQTDHPALPDVPLTTQRLLMTSSDRLPVFSDDIIAACRAAELIVTRVVRVFPLSPLLAAVFDQSNRRT